MITTGLLNISFFLFSGLLALLPAGSGFPTAAHSAATALGGYIGILSPLVPLSTLATIIGLVFSVEIAFFGWRSLKWILSHVPFIGGHG